MVDDAEERLKSRDSSLDLVVDLHEGLDGLEEHHHRGDDGGEAAGGEAAHE